MNILGIKVDDISKNEALELVEGWFSKGGKRYITTPNPEMIVQAQNDSQFKEILNKADLAIPDGVGLKLAGIKNRLTGVDLMLDLIKLSNKKGFAVGFLGGRNGVAVKAKDRLLKSYPNLKVSFAQEEINGQSLSGKPGTDILFVAFGHGKQEKWIAKNLEDLPIKVAMGVGGAFDYIAERVPRAPIWVRKLGFEWLFRLMIQPWRIKRQLALIKYLWLIKTTH
jgi:N-acetylglucosaminyldiphosphoundecaprenol N-acetyl-beta-D-mannosaminyltransferase